VNGKSTIGDSHVGSRARPGGVQRAAIRGLDVALSATMLVLFSPLILVLALAICIDDRGTVFFRARRVGKDGAEFMMLKFRKMRMGSGGPPLTSTGDERFTRLGRFLAGTKLDELPQLWNVIRGQMSLVGPRPEDPTLVARDSAIFEDVLSVKPGITGFAQLAYARENEVLGDASGNDRIDLYFERVLPQKLTLDRLYADTVSLATYVRVLWWTMVAVVLRKSVAVDRSSGQLGVRRRPAPGTSAMPVEVAPLPTTEAETPGTPA
jgi:lipopolysaccharide/colanic/teichoic acid biosynthesis glycosyltransferase